MESHAPPPINYSLMRPLVTNEASIYADVGGHHAHPVGDQP